MELRNNNDSHLFDQMSTIKLIPEEWAALLDISLGTFYNYKKRAGNSNFNRHHLHTIENMMELFAKGEPILGAEGFREWLRSPHPDLKNKRPFDVLLERNGHQEVMRIFIALETGVYL